MKVHRARADLRICRRCSSPRPALATPGAMFQGSCDAAAAGGRSGRARCITRPGPSEDHETHKAAWPGAASRVSSFLNLATMRPLSLRAGGPGQATRAQPQHLESPRTRPRPGHWRPSFESPSPPRSRRRAWHWQVHCTVHWHSSMRDGSLPLPQRGSEVDSNLIKSA
jgi:hypothetical protein